MRVVFLVRHRSFSVHLVPPLNSFQMSSFSSGSQSAPSSVVFVFSPTVLRTMQLSNAIRDRLAAGYFTSSKLAPVLQNPDHHPLFKVIKGGTPVREQQFLSSQRTEAIILAYKKKLCTLNVCSLGFDTDVDENEEHPVISGGLGDEVSTSLPVYILKDEVTSDFLFLGTPEETQLFPSYF